MEFVPCCDYGPGCHAEHQKDRKEKEVFHFCRIPCAENRLTAEGKHSGIQTKLQNNYDGFHDPSHNTD